MKIVIFTGNQLRHQYFIKEMSKITKDLYVIQECKTIFPGHIEEKGAKKSPFMEDYFDKVREAERKIFGRYEFLKDINCLSIRNGDLSLLTMEDLKSIEDADYYIVFGSSYIKGDVFDYLLKKKAVNLHMGVSPYYRGSACNFWALYDGKPEYVGATIHLLDKEIDGGGILYHALPKATKCDGFELGMLAVKAGIDSIAERVRNNTLDVNHVIEQEFEEEDRISKRNEFSDEIVKEYNTKLMSSDEIENAIQKRKMDDFVDAWVR